MKACYWPQSIQGEVWNDKGKPITIIQGENTAWDYAGAELEHTIQTQEYFYLR